MQSREQIKNWKVVASVASVTALGITGLVVANPGQASQAPAPIEIEDRRASSGFSSTSTTELGFEIVPGPSLTQGDHSLDLDSPLASADLDSLDSNDSPSATDSPVSSDSPDQVDSPDQTDSPDGADSPDQTDSPDGADSPDQTDSPDGADSPDQTDSPDGADSPDDSADSIDSLDS